MYHTGNPRQGARARGATPTGEPHSQQAKRTTSARRLGVGRLPPTRKHSALSHRGGCQSRGVLCVLRVPCTTVTPQAPAGLSYTRDAASAVSSHRPPQTSSSQLEEAARAAARQRRARSRPPLESRFCLRSVGVASRGWPRPLCPPQPTPPRVPSPDVGALLVRGDPLAAASEPGSQPAAFSNLFCARSALERCRPVVAHFVAPRRCCRPSRARRFLFESTTLCLARRSLHAEPSSSLAGIWSSSFASKRLAAA